MDILEIMERNGINRYMGISDVQNKNIPGLYYCWSDNSWLGIGE